MQNETTSGLSDAETQDLRCIAATMIPASKEYGVPGADDALIFADIVKSIGRDMRDLQTALGRIRELSGGAYADLPEARRQEVAAAFQAEGGVPLATVSRVVLQCYYRDDRVVRSLGLEPRAPFPKGHTLEQGDWSLLDPVKARPKMWRDAP